MTRNIKIGIVVLIIALIALYVYNRYRKAKQAPVTDPNANPVNNTNTEVKPTANDNFPLQRGSKGENVRYLQQALNRLNPNANLTLDGDFGPSTYAIYLLTIGTTVDIDGVVYSAYPVTQKVFTEILNESTSSTNKEAPQLPNFMDGEVYM